MVVIEAILSGIPLALADNDDMRRFNLDNKHYFDSYEKLLAIIQNNIKNEFVDLLVSEQIRETLLRERSLIKVTNSWVSLFSSLK
jgi:hypothetical protein